MKIPMKRLSRDELIAAIIAIILPLGIIMASTIFVIRESGEENSLRAVRNRVETFSGYAALLITSVDSQKELPNLIKDFRSTTAINTIAIISEETSGELAFLKKRRYIIYPGSNKENKILSSEDKNDKRIFDLISHTDQNISTATLEEEGQIHHIRRVNKNGQTFYIYILEKLFSTNDLPIPVVNALLSVL
ncbi:MAG: hypothetical protein ACPL7I_08820, partial [Myxococcota bacterium]